MPYDFFLGYPRINTEPDSYVVRFFNDLSKEVRRLRGLPESVQVGFFGQVHVQRNDWRPAQLAGLNESRTIVPLFGPAFYNSADCLRELELFQERLNGVPRQAPPVTAVLWTTGVVPMPAALGRLQYTYGNANAVENTQGLLHSYKSGKNRDNFLDRLARDIIAASDEQPPLPPIADGYEGAAVSPAPSLNLAGPGHVHFVYVAPAERSWRPFHPPATQAVGPLTQEVAGSNEFTSDELHFNDQIVNAMREAGRRQNLVILIVDGRSVQVAPYDSVVRDVNDGMLRNASIIVPWNPNDPASAANIEQLRRDVRNALDTWTEPGDTLRFDDTVTTCEDFKTALADKLIRLRAKVFNGGSNRPVPSVPRPILTNTGTAA